MDSIKARFFGRKKIIKDIVQGVLATNQPLDFSLVGPKMIGKTRLLNHLAAANGPLRGADPEGWRPERFRDGNNVIVGLINCDWPAAQSNLPQFINQRLRLQLEAEQNLGLDWTRIERAGSPGQQIVQIARQLDQQQIRLLLLLDNIEDILRGSQINLDMINELRPLANELGLIVATDQPLHDLNQTLAASPLFNLMHQHFVGLLESDVVKEWLDAYNQRISWAQPVGQAFVEMVGGHPFLLARLNDVLLEIEPLLPAEGPVDIEQLAFIKLRLAEHGRPLFEMLWRKLNEAKFESIIPMVKRLITAPLAITQVSIENSAALNWLINFAIVTYDSHGYHLFSPLFQEFLTDQLSIDQHIPAVWPVTSAAVGTGAGSTNIFEKLTPIESELLRYFQAHVDTVVSVEQLLTDVWHQPDASPRRVQEAIRRLRLRLNKHTPRLGVIENERGVGYRFVPAHTGFE